MSSRLSLRVDDDIPAMVEELAPTPNSKGAVVSDIIRAHYHGARAVPDVERMSVEALRLLVLGLAGRVTAVEGEQQQARLQLAALIARDA